MPTKPTLDIQPLDQIMTTRALTNTDLVKASSEQLTHKMVAKGRAGRRLTLNIQNKILEALNAASPEGNFKLQDIFNY